MIIEAIRYSSQATIPGVPDAFLRGTLRGRARLCSVHLQANSYGLDVFPPFDFEAVWHGGSDFVVTTANQAVAEYVWSREIEQYIGVPTNFWCSKIPGVLQLDVGWIFRTAPKIKLFLTGAVNQPDPGAWVHAGIVDSDWFHVPFTINIQWHRANERIRFNRDRPIARLLPLVPHADGSDLTLELRDLAQEPALVKAWNDYIDEVYGDRRLMPERQVLGVYKRMKAKQESSHGA